MVMPMGYKRINTIEDLLQNKNRSKIYNTIMKYPGSSFTELRMLLMIKNGTLSHHLIKLEKEGLIRSKKIGIFRRYYPSSGAIPKDLEELITDVVLEYPGISQSMVAKKLDITRQVANYHINSLKKRGHLIVKKNGRNSQIYLR
ncbi:MAG: winged helix-turn-helix transcriptional regulator [Thermoplasmatota archaeon]